MGMRVMVILYFFEIPGWNNYTSYILNDLKNMVHKVEFITECK